MPALDTERNTRVRPPKVKKRKQPVYGPPAPKPKPTVLTRPTPDQADRNRSAKQQARDKEISERNIRTATKRVVAKRTAPNRQLDTEDTRTRAVPRAKAPEKTIVVAGPRGMSVEHVKGRTTGEILESWRRPARSRTIRVAAPRGMARSTTVVGPDVGELLKTAAVNAPADATEILTTMPSSAYRTAEVAVTHPKQLPGMLIEPYKELVRDPVKAFGEHPVTTTLMLAPVVKVPARTVGRVGALTGKRSLAGEEATYAGTSVRAQRHRTTDVSRRNVLRRKPGKDVSDEELTQRVDEAWDAAALHRHSVVNRAAEQAHAAYGHLPEAERAAKVQKKLKGARRGAGQQAKRRFAQEFGSDWYVDPASRALVRPKRSPENSGVLHATREDAQRVADRVPFDAVVIRLKGGKRNENWAVVPRVAWERWQKHQKTNTSKATPAVALRLTNRMLKTAVLPTSTKWMGGQVAEGLIRAAVMGAGPTSFIRGKKLLRALPEDVRREVELRTTRGGQFGATGPAEEFASKAPTLAEEFQHAGPRVQRIAEGATKAGALPGLRHLRGGYRRYVTGVFRINDKVEQLAKTAMLGKAVKSGPLMERSVTGLTKKAIDDAAKGLHGTSSQVELGRALDRAYGRYSKFSPEMRNVLAHWTPFIPWMLNMGKFLLDVLPKDHPVATALIADMSQATEEWRKEHDLSTLVEDHVPDFVLGSAPTKNGRYVRLGAFGPFMPAEPVSAAVGNLLPIVRGPILAGAGVDFAGRDLGEGELVKLGAGALGMAESLVPGVSQLGRVTGLSERVRGRGKRADEIRKKGIPQSVLDLLNPLRPIGEANNTSGVPGGDPIEVAAVDLGAGWQERGDSSIAEPPAKVSREHPEPPRRVVKRKTPTGKRTTRVVKATPRRRTVKRRTLYRWPSDPPGKPAAHTIPWREHEAHLVAWHANRSRRAR